MYGIMLNKVLLKLGEPCLTILPSWYEVPDWYIAGSTPQNAHNFLELSKREKSPNSPIIDAAEMTEIPGMLTIGEKAVVDTINVVCADKYTPALTIEAGATVGKIVYKGVAYTQAEWMARG